jgi:ABC-type spermidine/putrescine transport system permease subunit II
VQVAAYLHIPILMSMINAFALSSGKMAQFQASFLARWWQGAYAPACVRSCVRFVGKPRQ